MRTIDLSPLYRSVVGIDRMVDMLEAATRADAAGNGYPPFNIEETDENAYRIELAVAGFSEADLNVEVKDNTLTISGKRGDTAEGRQYLHRGIAERAFERRFKLAEHVVVNGAELRNGLLLVDLTREIPESAKARTIAITNKADSVKRLAEGAAA